MDPGTVRPKYEDETARPVVIVVSVFRSIRSDDLFHTSPRFLIIFEDALQKEFPVPGKDFRGKRVETALH